MLRTVDNFRPSTECDVVGHGFRFGDKKNDTYYFDSSTQIKNDIHITLGKYQSVCGKVFSLLDRDSKSDKDLILSISKSTDGKYDVKTENYVGKFTYYGLEVDIRSRFSNVFMMRMLNFANDVFLDDVSAFDASASKDLDFSKFIIYYMFIQKLEKAFLLGLPKAYRSIHHHDMKLKGKIDINRFIKRDIPFQGKISSVSREQKEIHEIIDVLYKAVQVIDKHGKYLTSKIAHIKTHLKQQRSNQYISPSTIQRAMASKALQNPIFAPYKSVLEYAKLIIDGSNLEESVKGKEKTFGFLVNVAELFELYVTKLLQKEFPDWSVDSPRLRLDKKFGGSYLYKRRIIPDIVMKHRESNKVVVFDTKYKRMKFNEIKCNGVDIDRCDFFQINTYMNYYNNQSQYNLIAGGLLYPMDAQFDKTKCHADNWFSNQAVKFVVDGIDLYSLNDSADENEVMQDIQTREEAFIGRIKGMTGDIRHQGIYHEKAA